MFANDYSSHKANSNGDSDDDSGYLPVIIAASCACVLLLLIAIVLIVIIIRVKRRGKDSKFNLLSFLTYLCMHTNTIFLCKRFLHIEEKNIASNGRVTLGFCSCTLFYVKMLGMVYFCNKTIILTFLSEQCYWLANVKLVCGNINK